MPGNSKACIIVLNAVASVIVYQVIFPRYLTCHSVQLVLSESCPALYSAFISMALNTS